MHLSNYHFYNPKNHLYSKPLKGLQVSEVGYCFHFNGKEKDNETYGEGNAYDFGARIQDPRLGRWLSVDPEYYKTSFMTPYHFALNNPIVFIDPDGNTEYFFQGKWIGTDGVTNNLIGVIQEETVALTITGNSMKGLKVPVIQNLKNGDMINGGMAIDKNVLSLSVEVLEKAKASTLKDEEFTVAMDEKNGTFDQNGPIMSNGGATEADGTAKGTVSPGKVGIHSHPYNDVNKNDKGEPISSAAFPSQKDIKAFQSGYDMNIIVGRSAFVQEKTTTWDNGMVVKQNILGDPVINIYGPKTSTEGEAPKFSIDGGDAKKIITNGNSGNVYNKFKKNEVK